MTLTYYRKRGEPTTELETCAARGVGTKDIVLIETGNRSKPESKTGPVPITSAHHFFISKEYYPPPQEIAQMASLFTFYFTPTIIAVTTVLSGLLYLGSLVFDHDVSRVQYILSTACSLLLKLKFPKILKHKRTSVCYATQFPSSGL